MLLWLWCGWASAQDQVLWDFDARMPDWSEGWGYAALVPSAFPSGGQALELEPFMNWDYSVAASVWLRPPPPERVVVTRELMTFDFESYVIGWGPPDVSLWVDGLDETGAYIAAAYGFSYEIGPGSTDISPLCGLWLEASVLALTDEPMTDPPPWTVIIDNFALSGPVCPGFVDSDADGRCLQGWDTDGDGLCVSDGEPLPPGGRADCDDAVFGPACLEISVGPAVPGGVVEVIVTGAEPGELVWVAKSPAPGLTCPPRLGGVCLDLDAPTRFGSGVADATGTALVSRALPADTLPGTVRWLQAAVVRSGADSDRSAAVAVTAE